MENDLANGFNDPSDVVQRIFGRQRIDKSRGKVKNVLCARFIKFYTSTKDILLRIKDICMNKDYSGNGDDLYKEMFFAGSFQDECSDDLTIFQHKTL